MKVLAVLWAAALSFFAYRCARAIINRQVEFEKAVEAAWERQAKSMESWGNELVRDVQERVVPR